MKTYLDVLYERIPEEIKQFVKKQGDIAIRINKILRDKEISSKEFAKKIGMKESQLNKIIRGDANPTLKTITKIEAAIDFDIIVVPEYGDK